MPKTTFLISVGWRIAKIRRDKGYSQALLAEKANISISHLSNIERGRKSLSAEILFKIAEALQTSVDSLLLTDIPQVHMQIEREIGININNCKRNQRYEWNEW